MNTSTSKLSEACIERARAAYAAYVRAKREAWERGDVAAMDAALDTYCNALRDAVNNQPA
jgi:hypothetical protein